MFQTPFFFEKLIPSHIQQILPIVMDGSKIKVYVLYGSRKFHSGRTGISLSKKRKIMSRQIRKELELLSVSEKNNYDDHLYVFHVYMKNRIFFMEIIFQEQSQAIFFVLNSSTIFFSFILQSISHSVCLIPWRGSFSGGGGRGFFKSKLSFN